MKRSENKINLLWLTDDDTQPVWDLGNVFTCSPTPGAIDKCLKSHLLGTSAAAWLFWDPVLSAPEPESLLSLLDGPADTWHAGLHLGLQGLPDWIDFVSPTWMLNRDPDKDIQASSWRLSLRGCLVRTEVLRQLGGPDPNYQSLEAAGLELGFRFIRLGAFVQHVPGMVTPPPGQRPPVIPLADQVRFIQIGFGRRWVRWAGFRAVAIRADIPTAVLNTLRQAAQQPPPTNPVPYQRPATTPNPPHSGARVTVLIPTVNRYPYLRTLLWQLREQTVPPLEVIVVDQTPPAQRDSTFQDEFSDLPLRWFTLDRAGQCSSRNLGLQKAEGDYILFLDDDDEIPPYLIQIHLSRLSEPGINISNGVAHEVGVGELPPDFQFRRISNVFPTNNTMLRKSVLHTSGLFDLAYDHGQRADHDLGMRLYLSGELLVLNPEISVLHHHASVGGLREHKARVDTYASSRGSLLKLDLPTVSDIYLAKRYYSPLQVREMLWISVLGTFSVRGPQWKRALKALLSALRLPFTIWRIHQRCNQAVALMEDYPQIPHLEDPSTI
jgi:glycosyltransferase involved in cell wall biosynthesis